MSNVFGIPDRKDYGDISKLQAGGLVDWIIQQHEARRAGCFTADTPIKLANGVEVAINTLMPGCAVTTYKDIAHVNRLWYNGIGYEWLLVHTKSRRIITTPNHLFMVKDIGWVPIGFLEGLSTYVDTEGCIRANEKDLCYLQQKICNQSSLATNVRSQLCYNIGTYNQRQKDISSNDTTTQTTSISCTPTTSSQQNKALARTSKQGLVNTSVRKESIKYARNRSAARLLSHGYYNRHALSPNTNKNTYDRTCKREDNRSEGTQLEGWSIQRKSSWFCGWIPYTPKITRTIINRARRKVRMVWEDQSTHRSKSSKTIQILIPTHKRKLCTTVYKLPRSTRCTFPRDGWEILRIEQLPRMGRGRYDLEIENAGCYYAGGFLVHNSHKDIRLGTPDLGLYSWASRKDLPIPGKKTLAVRQPIHAHSYGQFEGEISEGYGAGTVKKQQEGKILITRVEPDKIHFSTASTRYPERFVLFKPKGGIGGKENNWLLMNTTPTKPLDFPKVKYKSVPADKVEQVLDNLEPGSSVQAKIDGALTLTKLLKDKIELLSYRTSKVHGGPILHTERVFHREPNVSIPKEYVGSVLSGELYGLDDKNQPITPQALGGILNSSLAKSIGTQQDRGIRFKNQIFDIRQLGKKRISNEQTPYQQRANYIRHILDAMGGPEANSVGSVYDPPHISEAKTKEDAKRLYTDIAAGKHPTTAEGIVVHPPTGKPMKSKLFDEHDVWIRGVFPGKGKYTDKGVGGFIYSHEPNSDIVGEIGTGLSDDLRYDMFNSPDTYLGRRARIRTTGKLPSGALFQPSLISLHEG